MSGEPLPAELLDRANKELKVHNLMDAQSPDIYLAASGPIRTFWDTAVHIVDLSGATPVKTDYPGVPINEINLRFAAVSAQKWIVSSYFGAVLDGARLAYATPRFFGYGSAWALGSRSPRAR